MPEVSPLSCGHDREDAVAGMWMFVGTLVVAYVVPGPDMALVMQVGGDRGRVAAVAAGLAVARGTHVAVAAAGLVAVLAAVPAGWAVVRGVGAAYLGWLGFRLWRAARAGSCSVGGGAGGAFVRGLLTNLLNPKALLFCSTLLPQFTDPGRGGLALQFLALGAILVVVGLAFDLAYGLSGAGLGRRLSSSAVWPRRAGAAVLGGFAVHMALTAAGVV